MFSSLRGSAAFKKEIERWVLEGIITSEQAKQLIDRYELDAEAPWYKNSTFILRGIGLLFVVMGLFLFIAANWSILPTVARMMTGFIPLAAAYTIAIAQYRRGATQNAELAMFFASLVFGANIALQAQIFHISSYFPDGLLWWMLGALPVMLFFRSILTVIVFQIIFWMWLAMQSTHHQFAWLGLPLLLCFAYIAWLQASSSLILSLFLSFFGFCYNALLNLEQWLDNRGETVDGAVFMLLIPACLLLYDGFIEWKKAHFNEQLSLGFHRFVRIVLIGLFFPFTFSDVHESVANIGDRLPWSPYALLMVAVVVALLKPRFTIDLAFVWLMALLMMFSPLTGKANVLMAVICNLLLVTYAIWKIYHGISQGIKRRFMLGIGILLVLAFKYYVTLIEDYTTSALLFIVFGVGLYFINKLWESKYAK
jgi:uncharacterized membrane protein